MKDAEGSVLRVYDPGYMNTINAVIKYIIN